MVLIAALALFLCAVLSFGLLLKPHLRTCQQHPRKIPVSVNYHFTRQCNYNCGFCFHTATTSHIETPDRQKQALRLLADAGMRKINFAGGEPFLNPKMLGDMIDFCKRDLHLESVSIVTNGSLIKESFLKKHADQLDILAVSCDSFDETTNIKIGRGTGEQVKKLYEIAGWCRKYGIAFKLNTVVNRFNVHEDMNRHIEELQPFRWKCFQVLIVPGENDSDDTKRNGHEFTISDSEFDAFCQRHTRQQACLVLEPNRLMASSYLILDEYLRFVDKTGKQPSGSILEVGVQRALESVFWDENAFLERGGLYDWVKPEGEKSCGTAAEMFDW